ncbi:MAG: flagellar basal body-associated FliL family protein [Gallionella sp.]
MATAKPGTGGKPAATENAAPPVKSGKKKLFLIILVLLLAAGGAAAYYFMRPAHESVAKEKPAPEMPPKYVELGTFTDNLVHEDTDRYLQVSISVKISKPGLEEEIKARNPEILDHVNMLLSSQRPSVLYTVAGKRKLANDIKTQIETVLGIHAAAAAPSAPAEAASSAPVAAAASAPVAAAETADKSGIDEVLFTSFIIQ